MLRRLHVIGLLLATPLALGALGACKKKADAPAGGSATATGSAAPATPTKVTLALDDKVVTEAVPLGGAPRPLAELVPGAPAYDTWIAVEAIDQAGTVNSILAPAKNHAGAVPALTADARGAVFGLLRDGKLEQPVTGIARVTIKTTFEAGKPVEHADHGGDTGGGGGGGDSGGGGEHGGGGNQADKGVRQVPTAELKIEIEGPGGKKSTFTGDKMVGLPEIHAPSGDTETPGWNLVDVLGAAGIKDAKAVVLTDEGNAALRIEGADWDTTKTMLYLKLNRSGVIRFRVFRKTGDLWEVAGELRGIKTIKVP